MLRAEAGDRVMSVEALELRAYRETYRCDEPGCEGLVKATGSGVHVGGASNYPHLCEKCHRRYDFGCCYPRIVHRPVVYLGDGA